MTYVIDGLLVALFALCVYIGWRRGFVKTISGLIALVAALLVATTFAGPLAEWVHANMVEPTVISTLEEHFTGDIPSEPAEIAMALDKLPAFITDLLDPEQVGDPEAIFNQMMNLEEGETAADAIADRIITPVVLPVLEMVCSIILFILTYIVATILLRFLDLVTKLPVLKQLNGLLGVVAGGLTGAVWVVFAARILFLLAAMGVAEWLTPAVMEKTWLASFANSLFPSFEA